MMDLFVIWCGVTLKKIKQDLQCLQEGQVTYLEVKYWTNFYILMGLNIFRGLTSFAQKDISFYSNKSFPLYGRLLTIYTEWEI